MEQVRIPSISKETKVINDSSAGVSASSFGRICRTQGVILSSNEVSDELPKTPQPEEKKVLVDFKISHVPSLRCSDVVALERAPNVESSFGFFVENICDILSFERISVNCDALKSPIIVGDDLYPKRVQLIIIFELDGIEKTIKSLSKGELSYVIVVVDNVSGESRELDLVLLLTRNCGSVSKEASLDLLNPIHNPNILFSMLFRLKFMISKTLSSVEPHRDVHLDLQRKNICNSVSKNVLEQIYKYLGHDNLEIICGNSLHIGTVKFFYPLNKFYTRSGAVCLRELEPGHTSMPISDIRVGQDKLTDFKYDEKTTRASCLTSKMILKTLLQQHKLREFLDSMYPLCQH